MTDFRVGQILYIIPSDNAVVVPVQIMERRISETAGGTVVKHIIKSHKAKAQAMVLETVRGTVYADLKQARDAMLRNATAAIDAMVRQASNTAQQAFMPQQQQQDSARDDADPLASADVFIEEPDDAFAVHHEPIQQTHLLPPPPGPSRSNGHVTMPPDVVSDETAEVMLPDGTMKRVRVKMG